MFKNIPLPWAVCETAPNPQWYPGVTIYSVTHGRRVADAVSLGFSEEQTREISAFIVKAANSHEALVKALTEAAERLEARGHNFGAREARDVLDLMGRQQPQENVNG